MVTDQRVRVRFALVGVNFLLLQCVKERNGARKRTVDRFHSQMDLSSDPDAMVLLSGDQARADMPARWPSSTCIHLPVAKSQTLTVASAAEPLSKQNQPSALY